MSSIDLHECATFFHVLAPLREQTSPPTKLTSLSALNQQRRRQYDEYVTDELVIQTHLRGLNATKQVRIKNGRDEAITITQPDYKTILKFLDMAYKVKGAYVTK